MKKILALILICGISISLSGCLWAAVAGVAAVGGATGAYVMEKDK
jgi:hypothetical protein